MSLPAEILDVILGFLQSDRASLKVCSRSHPILFQLAERHLYTDIVFHHGLNPDLHYDRYPLNHDHLDDLKVLRECPHIANYVRTLRIIVGWSDSDAFLEEISPILRMLSMLREIWFSDFAGLNSLQVPPWQMPKNFHMAFLECLRLPSMRDFYLEKLPLPLSILSHCKHIRKVSLVDWYPNDESVDITTLPTIDSLALDEVDDEFIPTIVCWVQSCHISSLECSSQSFEALSPIFTSCSHSLTSLNVHVDYEYAALHYLETDTTSHYSGVIPIPLDILVNLQQFTVRAVLMYGSAGRLIFSSIPTIAKLLKPVSSLKCLTLGLTLDFYFFVKSYEEDQHHIGNVICGQLHSLLVQSASTIHSIDFEISPSRDCMPSDVALSLFAAHPGLMQFVESGRLTLTKVKEGMFF